MTSLWIPLRIADHMRGSRSAPIVCCFVFLLGFLVLFQTCFMTASAVVVSSSSSSYSLSVSQLMHFRQHGHVMLRGVAADELLGKEQPDQNEEEKKGGEGKAGKRGTPVLSRSDFLAAVGAVREKFYEDALDRMQCPHIIEEKHLRKASEIQKKERSKPTTDTKKDGKKRKEGKGQAESGTVHEDIFLENNSMEKSIYADEDLVACMKWHELQGHENIPDPPYFQYLHLHRSNKAMERFAINEKFGKIAATLLQVEGVRLYQSSAFIKPPMPEKRKRRDQDHEEDEESLSLFTSPTSWHYDLNMIPLDTNNYGTLWCPLHRIRRNDSVLVFASGSHTDTAFAQWYAGNGAAEEETEEEETTDLFGGAAKLPRKENSLKQWTNAGYDISSHDALMMDRYLHKDYGSYEIGDCTFHHGFTYHASTFNEGTQQREAIALGFVDAKAIPLHQNTHPVNDEDYLSWADWIDEVSASGSIDHPLLPLVYSNTKHLLHELSSSSSSFSATSVHGDDTTANTSFEQQRMLDFQKGVPFFEYWKDLARPSVSSLSPEEEEKGGNTAKYESKAKGGQGGKENEGDASGERRAPLHLDDINIMVDSAGFSNLEINLLLEQLSSEPWITVGNEHTRNILFEIPASYGDNIGAPFGTKEQHHRKTEEEEEKDNTRNKNKKNQATDEFSSWPPQLGGVSLFWRVCALGHLPLAVYLAHGGANIHQRASAQHFRRTPLHAAIVNGHLPIVKFLLEQLVDPFINRTTSSTTSKPSPKKLDEKLSTKTEKTIVDEEIADGYEALNKIVYEMLVEQDDHGNSALHLAAAHSMPIVMYILRQFEGYVDASLRNHMGYTAYDIGVKRKDEMKSPIQRLKDHFVAWEEHHQHGSDEGTVEL